MYWLAEYGTYEEYDERADSNMQGGSATNIADVHVGTDGWPLFQTDSVVRGRSRYGEPRYKDHFLGAHNSINDASVTLLNALGCAIAYAGCGGITDSTGELVSRNTTPLDFSFPRHMIAVDCEGAGSTSQVFRTASGIVGYAT